MHIDQLTLKNFRNFESVDIPLNSKMNIVIGNNGSGKSSLLMGALTAASAFFLGIDYASPRSIKADDVRHVAHEVKKVYQQVAVYPVEVSCEGVVNEVACKWSRSLSGPKSNTTYGGASDLRNIASSLQKSASNEYSEDVLPLIAYYGTGRLWAQKQAKKKGKQKLRSRFEGYRDCIAEQATGKQLLEWFSETTLLVSQEGSIPQMTAVQQALERCFADLIDHDETQRVMLLIISENLAAEYEKVKSKTKPKTFAKANIRYGRRRYDNSTAFYEEYFGPDCEKLVNAIKAYRHHNGSHTRDEHYLAELLK